jgi:hypothetical protein
LKYSIHCDRNQYPGQGFRGIFGQDEQSINQSINQSPGMSRMPGDPAIMYSAMSSAMFSAMFSGCPQDVSAASRVEPDPAVAPDGLTASGQ